MGLGGNARISCSFYNLAVRQLRGEMATNHVPVTEFVFIFNDFTQMAGP